MTNVCPGALTVTTSCSASVGPNLAALNVSFDPVSNLPGVLIPNTALGLSLRAELEVVPLTVS